MLLMQIFSVQLGWLPTSGAATWKRYILPSITLGAAVAAVMARFTRALVRRGDPRRTSCAPRAPRACASASVIIKHCLRNALIPVVTMMGLQFGFLLGGSILVEAVFNWPGLGRLLVDAVQMRDYPVIQTLSAAVLARVHPDQSGGRCAVRLHQPDHPLQVRHARAMIASHRRARRIHPPSTPPCQ